jgi:uncharacterized cupin superfamily protein
VNVNDDDGWEVFADRGDFRSRRRRLVGIAEHLGGSHRLGASVWEIPPGATQLAYHFHHVQEEFVVVLSGRPTLRTPAGERELEEGEVVFFSSGPQGAHQLFNRGQETVRVHVAGTTLAVREWAIRMGGRSCSGTSSARSRRSRSTASAETR